MDRKYHIVARGVEREEARVFQPYATEAFLTTLGNKGLYKRALKDLESVERIELSPCGEGEDGGSGIRVAWEEVAVSLSADIARSRCSCPSRTVCKHILMGILAAAEYASVAAEEKGENPEPAAEEPWSELKQLDLAALRKEAGKKEFDQAVRMYQAGWVAELKEGEMLEATLTVEPITVWFPRRQSLSRAVCKCGATGRLCRHKVIALLSYLNGREDPISLVEETEELPVLDDRTVELLTTADRYVVQVLSSGLVHCDETQAEVAFYYSIHLDRCRIGNLARLFRSLATDIENRLAKHTDFNRISTLATLARLHTTLRLILSNREDGHRLDRLIEPPRSAYYPVPYGTFTALGASPWQTRSGYFGITAYFFYHERQTVCTYTATLPDYYASTESRATLSGLRSMYHETMLWNDTASLAILSGSGFRLQNFRMNHLHRLSSSSQTRCELSGRVEEARIAALSLPAPSETMGDGEPAYDYFQKKQPPKLTAIRVDRPFGVTFDETAQTLTLTLENAEQEELFEAVLPYGEMSREAIRYLESRSRSNCDREACYVVCTVGKGPLTLTPVSLIDETGVVNFFFPAKSEKD